MVGVIVAVAVLVLFETLVWRYGADSRDGMDWAPPKPNRRSPVVR
jgi:hypothetical protein